MPTNIIPGGTYYWACKTRASFPVTFGLEVDFYPSAAHPAAAAGATAVITITSITYTNAATAPVAGADEFPVRDSVDDQSPAAVCMAHGPEPGHQRGVTRPNGHFKLV